MVRAIVLGVLAAAPLSLAAFLGSLALGLTRGHTALVNVAVMVLGGGFLAGWLTAPEGPRAWTLRQASGAAPAGLVFFVCVCGLAGAVAGKVAGILRRKQLGV